MANPVALDTSEQRARLRELLENGTYASNTIALDLLAEVENLHADNQSLSDRMELLRVALKTAEVQISMMRPIVEAVAEAFIDYGNSRHDVNVYRMLPVALIEQARAYLAAHPEPAAVEVEETTEREDK